MPSACITPIAVGNERNVNALTWHRFFNLALMAVNVKNTLVSRIIGEIPQASDPMPIIMCIIF